MPRQLLRDNQIVIDDWQYLTELEPGVATGVAAAAAAAPVVAWR